MTPVYPGAMELTISQAARRLEASERTVRRRLHNGALAGKQVSTPQGYVWLVELPDDLPNPESASCESLALRELVDVLKSQVEAHHQQISELHSLLQKAQSGLPAP